MSAKILLVDDDESIQFSLSRFLNAQSYLVRAVGSLAEAKKSIAQSDFDAVLLDMKLPDGSGLEFVQELREFQPSTAIILITAFGDIALAVQAMQSGADNFLTKPVRLNELEVFLKKSIEIKNLRQKQIGNQRLKVNIQPFFGPHPLTQKVLQLATFATRHDFTVLLNGETGTGKGILARWIHDLSPRKDKTFVEVNCASLKDDLLASELFGHARGSFTSAVQDKQGLIEVADGGTLFLDEISSMNLNIQSQLLKVIEEKSFRRVGETKVRSSDFRLVCASNRNLQQEVAEERFRNDLLFRINIFSIELPPLREIKENIPGLTQHILQEFNYPYRSISPEVLTLLSGYSWPGNIREMKNVIERALILSDHEPLAPNHFQGLQNRQAFSVPTEVRTLEKMEAEYIRYVYEYYRGDTVQAASALGISRPTLYRKLKQYEIPLY